MFDKMTPNQRLILAIALSVIFFLGYTTIFPPHDAKNDTAGASSGTVSSAGSDTQKSASVEQSAVQSDGSSVIAKVHSSDFVIEIDTLGRISSKKLLEKKYNQDDQSAELIPDSGHKPLYVRFVDTALNDEASSVAYRADLASLDLSDGAKKVTLTQDLSDVSITKEITFYADGHYDVEMKLSNDKRYFIYLGQRPQVTQKLMSVAGAMIYEKTKDLITIVEDGDAKGRESFSDVGLISAFDQYFATIIYNLPRDIAIYSDRDRSSNPVLYFDALPAMSFSGYIGPKDHKTLEAIDPILPKAIEYGWFTFAAKPLFIILSYLHGIFGNWGWAIIGLTIIVRIVLFPLTHKGMTSMQKLKEISPRIKELQAKYKGDPQRLNAAMMEMYKKHGANPLGGCLPMLLQIPIFFAIYRVLLNAVELQGASWLLWIDDLSRMDPTFILPLLMGASMYLQQKMTPNNFTDPIQEKIFKYLPVVFTLFFITFPSGLVLYWFVNNLFSISQQYLVNQQFKNKKTSVVAQQEPKSAEKK